MLTFSANLSMLFQEYEFNERFAQARLAGFTHVECLFPYEYPKHSLQQYLKQNKLQFSLFNAPAGKWDEGERGFAAIPQYKERFKNSVSQALDYAVALNCPRVHIMAGRLQKDNPLTFCDETFIENIRYAADLFSGYGIDVLIEPLNPRDNSNYYLCDFHKAIKLIRLIQRDNVKLQFDFYHAQIIHGDVSTLFQRYFAHVGHIQIASVPYRNEPNTGELNDNYLFNIIEQKGYVGQVGCEYHPATTTQDGLTWIRNYHNTL